MGTFAPQFHSTSSTGTIAAPRDYRTQMVQDVEGLTASLADATRNVDEVKRANDNRVEAAMKKVEKIQGQLHMVQSALDLLNGKAMVTSTHKVRSTNGKGNANAPSKKCIKHTLNCLKLFGPTGATYVDIAANMDYSVSSVKAAIAVLRKQGKVTDVGTRPRSKSVRGGRSSLLLAATSTL